jgi:hypothetical protein
MHFGFGSQIRLVVNLCSLCGVVLIVGCGHQALVVNMAKFTCASCNANISIRMGH